MRGQLRDLIREAAYMRAASYVVGVFEYDLSLPVLIGAELGAVYWGTDFVLRAVPGVGREALLVVGPVIGLLAAVGAAVASTRTLGDGETVAGRTARHVALWVLLFTGTAVMVSYVGTAVARVLWAGRLETPLWFGLVVLSTTAFGAVLIATGGGYHLVIRSRTKTAELGPQSLCPSSWGFSAVPYCSAWSL